MNSLVYLVAVVYVTTVCDAYICTTFSRVLCTFGVSGNGKVLFMSSASEIQRMSLVKNDRYDDPKQQYTL